jgi:hypothetical protein
MRVILARQAIPRQPLADNLTDGGIKTIRVLQRLAVFVLAVVVAVCLLVQVPEQVKWLDADVGSVQATFR